MNISKLRRLSMIDLGGAGIALLLTAIFGFGVLQPIHNRAMQLAAGTDAAVRERQHLASLQASIQSLSTELEQMNSRSATNPIRLLSSSNLNARLADIARLSSEWHLTVKDLKPGEGANAAHYINVPVLMTGSGNYCDCARMIHALHERLPDVDINAFRLTGSSDQPKNNCSFELNLNWRAALEKPANPLSQRTADLR
jgi:Tfp pilus assembly protein PilO